MSEMPTDLMYVTWSLPQLLLVLLIVVLLFGRGKISELMGDVAKGIKSFKKGLTEEETPKTETAQKSLEHDGVKPEMRAGTTSETKV